MAILFFILGQLPQLREYSQISDDDPLYDSVASDDDYASVPPENEVMILKNNFLYALILIF